MEEFIPNFTDKTEFECRDKSLLMVISGNFRLSNFDARLFDRIILYLCEFSDKTLVYRNETYS